MRRWGREGPGPRAAVAPKWMQLSGKEMKTELDEAESAPPGKACLSSPSEPPPLCLPSSPGSFPEGGTR